MAREGFELVISGLKFGNRGVEDDIWFVTGNQFIQRTINHGPFEVSILVNSPRIFADLGGIDINSADNFDRRL